MSVDLAHRFSACRNFRCQECRSSKGDVVCSITDAFSPRLSLPTSVTRMLSARTLAGLLPLVITTNALLFEPVSFFLGNLAQFVTDHTSLPHPL